MDLRLEYEAYSGQKAINNGVVNPDYMLWLESSLSLERAVNNTK